MSGYEKAIIDYSKQLNKKFEKYCEEEKSSYFK